MQDLELRATIYRHFADAGHAPTFSSLAELVGDAGRTQASLRRLHDGHMIVLGDDGEIAMALPFSSKPTDNVVSRDDSSWWANCAWDAFAVIAALGSDGHISSTWDDTGEPVAIDVVNGALSSTDGFVHFAVSARHWWDDIVET